MQDHERRRLHRRGSAKKALLASAVAISFLLPSLVLHLIFIIYPMVRTAVLSLYAWDGVNPVKTFLGLGNYGRILQDRVFWISLSHNVIWIIWDIGVASSVGLVLAVLVGSVARGRLIYRTIFFMPAVLSLIVVGIIWAWIYNPRFGILNVGLRRLGLDALAMEWLGNQNTALLALMVAHSWIWIGYCFVVFLAGLQRIDPSLYDAARIDGAGRWQVFVHVTIPELHDVTTIVYVWTVMNGLKVFGIVLVMTAGGPNYSTQTVANWMYERAIGGAIRAGNEVGFGSAIAFILGVIVISTSIVFMRLRERNN